MAWFSRQGTADFSAAGAAVSGAGCGRPGAAAGPLSSVIWVSFWWISRVVFTCITSSRISSYPTRSRMGPTARDHQAQGQVLKP